MSLSSEAGRVQAATATVPGQGRRFLRPAWLLALLLLVVLASFVLAAMLGSVAISWQELPVAALSLLQGQEEMSLNANLLKLRLTRAMSAFVAGASLSLAGVMMQALLRNPLAEPYVLGISGGAAVGALGAMLLYASVWQIDAGAFFGALAVAAVLYALARRDLRYGLAQEGGLSLLLLTGVMLSAGCMALVTLILALAPEGRLRSMVFWMIGDLSVTQWRLWPALLLAGVALPAWRGARAMNLMAMQAQLAQTLGVNVGALRIALFFGAALLTASSVAGGGTIGFVGLIVPHACRFAFGSDHRLLIPAATLIGGAFLLLADTLARTLFTPLQLPVGVVTALIGVPVFLLQLHHNGGAAGAGRGKGRGA